MTLTSLTWNDQTNSGTLGFVNSLTGGDTSTNIRLNSGELYTDFGGSNGSYIGEAMNIRPTSVPEPSVLVLLAAACVIGWLGCSLRHTFTKTSRGVVSGNRQRLVVRD